MIHGEAAEKITVIHLCDLTSFFFPAVALPSPLRTVLLTPTPYALRHAFSLPPYSSCAPAPAKRWPPPSTLRRRSCPVESGPAETSFSSGPLLPPSSHCGPRLGGVPRPVAESKMAIYLDRGARSRDDDAGDLAQDIRGRRTTPRARDHRMAALIDPDTTAARHIGISLSYASSFLYIYIYILSHFTV
ncbi:hypothetical protein HPB48_012488 [Haemaphysalis longicornis]|uniref:Uncharacterized protein n=1 Tax=Haemaphysalis longicornis TaxID=44386 RepID=A0A9J6GZK5_HAELO|nr:hypothetical protein HPB48_012488 [Haemaphysalis longicornis]